MTHLIEAANILTLRHLSTDPIPVSITNVFKNVKYAASAVAKSSPVMGRYCQIWR